MSATRKGPLTPEVRVTSISMKHWGPDDDYETVEVQVNAMCQWPRNQKVKVTVEPITEEQWEKYSKTGEIP